MRDRVVDLGLLHERIPRAYREHGWRVLAIADARSLGGEARYAVVLQGEERPRSEGYFPAEGSTPEDAVDQAVRQLVLTVSRPQGGSGKHAGIHGGRSDVRELDRDILSGLVSHHFSVCSMLADSTGGEDDLLTDDQVATLRAHAARSSEGLRALASTIHDDAVKHALWRLIETGNALQSTPSTSTRYRQMAAEYFTIVGSLLATLASPSQ